jgi:transcriptional regulator with XRE-family HTH domain
MVLAATYNLGLLQKEVAEQLGVGKTTVFNWERNRTTPALWLIPKVIHFLGYTPYPPGGSLAERIRQYRKTNGVSRKKLAAVIGVAPSTVAGWEEGKSEAQGELLNRLSGVLAPRATESCTATPGRTRLSAAKARASRSRAGSERLR